MSERVVEFLRAKLAELDGRRGWLASELMRAENQVNQIMDEIEIITKDIDSVQSAITQLEGN